MGLMSALDHQPQEPAQAANESELFCAFAGFVLGLFTSLVGAWLFYLGAFGKEPWGAASFGDASRLVDALPGTLLFLAGLFVIRGTRRKPVSK